MTTNNTTEMFYEIGNSAKRGAFELELDSDRRIATIQMFVRGDDGWIEVEYLGETEENYFPGYRATGFGNPPSWDCHLRAWPVVGEYVEDRRDLTFGK